MHLERTCDFPPGSVYITFTRAREIGWVTIHRCSARLFTYWANGTYNTGPSDSLELLLTILRSSLH